MSSNDDVHPIDLIDVRAKQAHNKALKEHMIFTSLPYEVFSTPAGKLLIERWKQILIDQPSAIPGADISEVWMNEGEKRFIRQTLEVIKQHED